MKSLRVPTIGPTIGAHRLDEDVSRYVVKVHRLKEGAPIRLFDPEAGVEAEGRVVRADVRGVTVEIERVDPAKDETVPVSLLQGLGKGDKPEQAIRDATVLGADRVVLVETDRTVAKVHGDDRKKRHRRVAVEAARQSGRGRLPVVEGPLSFDAALDAERAAKKFVCAWHPTARPVVDALESWIAGTSLALLIGPEGGLSEEELELALARGFEPVSLGPLVLRTETAATVALGVVTSWHHARGRG